MEFDEFMLLINNRINDNKFLESCVKAFGLFAETDENFITQKEFMNIVASAKKESNRFEVQNIMKELPWDKDGNLIIKDFLTEFMEEL